MRYGAVAALAAQFPPLETAHPDGFLCLGGDLRPERLLAAYSRGIFPWYEEGLPCSGGRQIHVACCRWRPFICPGAAPGPAPQAVCPYPGPGFWTGHPILRRTARRRARNLDHPGDDCGL